MAQLLTDADLWAQHHLDKFCMPNLIFANRPFLILDVRFFVCSTTLLLSQVQESHKIS